MHPPGENPLRPDIVAATVRPIPEFCQVIEEDLGDVIGQTSHATQSILQQLLSRDLLVEALVSDVDRLAGAVHRSERELDEVVAAKDLLLDRVIGFVLRRDDRSPSPTPSRRIAT